MSDIELGKYTDGNKQGVLHEVISETNTKHYKLIVDGTNENVLINIKNNEPIDTHGTKWGKVKPIGIE